MLERIRYRGWDNCYKLSNGTVELIVLADVGPRIISYGFCQGENQFYEAELDAGTTGGKEFRVYGGHRLWVSPEVERTYFPDNRPVKVSQHGNRVCFTAPLEDSPPGTNLQKEMQIELAASGTGVRVTHRIQNCDTSPTTLAPWTPTQMRAGGHAILPLSLRAAMDNDHLLPVGVFSIWSYTDFADPRWVFGTSYIQLRQLTEPTGRFREQMGGAYSPEGWVAHFRREVLFVKRAQVVAGAQYPDFGCNLEVFTNPELLEVETLGPLVELTPGETVEHTECWWLFSEVPGGEDEAWIESAIVPLVGKTVLF
jgi:hypothetical protein